MSARPWFIYALKDPRTDAIRYVGFSFNPKKRLSNHLERAARNLTHKDRWILKLRGEGITPSLEVLQRGEVEAEKYHAERAWIFKLRALGHDLVNTTDGGDSGFSGGVQTPEARAKIAAAGLGRKHTPETIAKLKASLSASPERAAFMKRLQAANTGKPRSPETKLKLSIAGKGRKLSAEHCAKISAASSKKKLKPEQIAALTAGRDNPITRAKIAASNRGKVRSEETRARIGAARRAAWVRDGGRRRA